MKWLLFICVFLLSPHAHAVIEKKGTAGLVAAESQNLTVGTSVTLRVYVEEALSKDSSWSITEQSTNGWLDLDLLLINSKSIQVSVENNGTTRFDFSGVLTKPGGGEIKPFKIENEAQTITIRAQGKITEIGSLLTDEEKKNQPNWILPPVPYGGWNYWLLSLIAAAAAIALGYIAKALYMRFWHKPPKQLSYFEQAQLDLSQIEKLISKQDRASQRKTGYLLAKVLRDFSQGRFGISATEMTDQEFLVALNRIPKIRDKNSAVESYLKNLDLLRYSEAQIDPTIAPKLLLDIREFILSNPPELEAK